MVKSIMEGVIELTKQIDGLSTIKDTVWQHKIDDKWYVAVNAKSVEVEIEPKDAMKITLKPYYVAVWYNGWLAGLFHPAAGGVIAAHPSKQGANEDTLIAAMNAKLSKHHSSA